MRLATKSTIRLTLKMLCFAVPLVGGLYYTVSARWGIPAAVCVAAFFAVWMGLNHVTRLRSAFRRYREDSDAAVEKARQEPWNIRNVELSPTTGDPAWICLLTMKGGEPFAVWADTAGAQAIHAELSALAERHKAIR